MKSVPNKAAQKPEPLESLTSFLNKALRNHGALVHVANHHLFPFATSPLCI